MLQDYKESVKCYQLAAGQGYAGSMRKLGGFYENKSVDYVLVHMWFNLAAVNGDKKGAELREMVAKDMAFPQIAEA